ncbi:trypsin-like serine peptidase [Streptomyces fenghuangensis]
MSATSRRRSALAAAAVAAALAVTAAACGPAEDESGAQAGPSATAPDGEGGPGIDGLRLPEELPAALKDFDPEKWKNGEWRNWDKDDWLREARDFVNPIIEGLWDPERMKDAEENDRRVDSDADGGGTGGGTGGEGDEGVTDPDPAPRKARPVATPYRENAPAVGKVFMDTPKGPMVCSGTVVEDPRSPGKSNLVATAGHCVHAGSAGGWFRNVVFVPAYNDSALRVSELEQASPTDVAPHGVFWATWAQTTEHWISNGSETGGLGASQDFAVLRVEAEDKSGKSLEETVGTAVPVDFGKPSVASLSSVRAYGYPAAPPFDGLTMHTCTDRPGRLTLSESESTMYRIGCTMTGGSSGGGWFAGEGSGERTLVSVTSIGTIDHTWLAGPRLGEEAEGVLEGVSEKFAGED